MTIQGISAQEKSDRGLPLSGADINELLKDPKSWVSKLYADCLLEAAISRAAFIQFVEATMLEHALAKKEEAAERNSAAHKESFEEQELNELVGRRDPMLQLSPMTVLKVELTALLSLSQQTMTSEQLAVHHQLLSANFNNQIAARLGPTVALPFTLGAQTQDIILNVPQLAAKAAASAAQVLAVSPALAERLRDSNSQQEAFAVHNNLNSTGPVAVMNQIQAILANNKLMLKERGVDIFNLMMTPSMLKKIDLATQACRLENQALNERLLENNRLSIPHVLAKIFAAKQTASLPLIDFPVSLPSVSKEPAFFGVNPMQAFLKATPGFKNKRNEEHEEAQQGYRGSRGR